MLKHKLLAKLSIGIASLALIIPLANLNNINVNARRRHVRTHQVYRHHKNRKSNRKNHKVNRKLHKSIRRNKNKRTRKFSKNFQRKNSKRVNRKYHKHVIRKHMNRKHNVRHIKSMKRRNKKHVARKHNYVNNNNSDNTNNSNDTNNESSNMNDSVHMDTDDDSDDGVTEQENDNTPFNKKAFDKALAAYNGYIAEENGYNSDWSVPKGGLRH